MTDLLTSKPVIQPKYNSKATIVLFEGDILDLLSSVPDNSVRLVITSPPYNLGKEYETRVALKTYLKQQLPILKELVRVLNSNGSLCWQVGNYVEEGEVFPLDIFYYDLFKDLGLKLRNRVIWHFGHGLHAKKRFSGRYETILWFTKSDDYLFNLDEVRVPQKYPGKRHFKGPNRGKLSGNPKGKNPSDFWEFLQNEWQEGIFEIPNVKANHPEKTIHPCQFPIELVERCVLAFTNEGDWVLDPFAGVGSTLVAAAKNRRKAMGADKEAEYIEITRSRLDRYYDGTLPIRQLGKKVYRPTKRDKIAQMPMEWLNQNAE